jgi:hypothetical protein
VWRHSATFDDVLSLADVDRALTVGGLRRPAFRLVHDGDVIAPSRYLRRARQGSEDIDDLIDTGRVMDLFAEGATIVLQGLQRWWEPAGRFCRELELGLGHAVQANAYLTPPGAAGLAPHHDTHDVFVLQCEGTKHWVVRRPAVDTPLPRHVTDHALAAEQPVLFEADLTAGDVLYLPRGVVHSAAAQEGVSLHLTLGILATTVHDVLADLVDAAADDVTFRRSLPAGWPFDGDLATGAVKDVVADLVEWLGRVDPAALAAGLRTRWVSNRAPLLAGQLGEILALPGLDDTTVLRPRAGTITQLDTTGDGRLRLTLGDRTLVLPAALEPALRRLLDGPELRVGDLADLLDAPSRLVLVRRLVREGALRTGGLPADG